VAESRFQRAAQEREERRAASGGGKFFFKPSPEGATIRFLEDLPEIEANQSRSFHKMPPQGKRKYAWWEVCLDQDEDGRRTGDPCPGCEANEEEWGSFPRSERGFVNIIWRDAPVTKKGKDGKRETTDETKDQVAVWNFPQTVGEKLYELHLAFKDLTSRDFVVKRTGTGFDTVYSIQPWTDSEGDSSKRPMSDEDLALAAEKTDFSADVSLKKYEDWGKAPEKSESKGGSNEPPDGNTDNPFKRKKQPADE
jgi:hypothetical protein